VRPPRLELEPILADERIALSAGNAAARDWRPAIPYMHSRFPGGIKSFCDSNLAVCSVLFETLVQLATKPGNRLVTVSDASHKFTFRALTQGAADPAKRLSVRYLAATDVTSIAPPARFEIKDSIDFDLERLQDPQAKDRLGRLVGVDALSRDERIAVKYAVLTYFQSGTRDAEVDAVLPAGAKAKPLLYVLRMLPESNDVTVEALGQRHLTHCEVRRAPGFPAGGDATVTREWLHRRLPAIAPVGETPKEMIVNAQRAIDAQAGDPKWFHDNYRIAVLEPAAADRHLAEMFKIRPFTRYAASAPESEFFPEAFSLFLLNPDWAHKDYPVLYSSELAYANRPAVHH